MTYFWETVDTIAPGLGWPHFGPFHLAVLAVFLLLGAVLCSSYCGMDTDKRRRWRRTVALLLIADELFKDFGLLYGGNFSLDYLPLHLCSINIFLIALHAWRRPKLLDTFLYFVCLPAACAALLFPTWTPLPPLNFMVIHKPAVIQYTKHTAPKIIEPSVNPDSDGYIFGYRMVGIADIYANKTAGVYAHHKAVG